MKKSNLWTFLVAYTALLTFAMAFQSVPPLLGSIITELRFDYAQGGLLMGLFSLPGILISMPGGWLSDRFGFKNVAIVSLILTMIGTIIVSTGSSFSQLAIGRIISGIGALTLVIIAASLVSITFKEKNLNIAMGIYNTGMPLGTILSFNILAIIEKSYGWRLATMVPILPAIILFIWILLKTDLPILQDTIKAGQSLKKTGRLIWILGLNWLFFNAAAISFLTFATDYFITLDHSEQAASFMASTFMWSAVFVSPAIGFMMSKTKRLSPYILFGSAAPALLYALFPVFPEYSLMLAIAAGAAASVLPPALFAMPARLAQPEFQGLAFGILSTCLNFGVLIGPFLIGFTRDRTLSYGPGFLAMGTFSVLAALAVVPLLKKRY